MEPNYVFYNLSYFHYLIINVLNHNNHSELIKLLSFIKKERNKIKKIYNEMMSFIADLNAIFSDECMNPEIKDSLVKKYTTIDPPFYLNNNEIYSRKNLAKFSTEIGEIQGYFDSLRLLNFNVDEFINRLETRISEKLDDINNKLCIIDDPLCTIYKIIYDNIESMNLSRECKNEITVEAIEKIHYFLTQKEEKENGKKLNFEELMSGSLKILNDEVIKILNKFY